MKIQIYINSLGHPYVLDYEFGKYEKVPEDILPLCRELVSQETKEEFELCFVKEINSKSPSLVIAAIMANIDIKSEVIQKCYPEFYSTQMKEMGTTPFKKGNRFLLDCLLEDWIEKEDALFQDWLIEMRHPNLFTARPAIA